MYIEIPIGSALDSDSESMPEFVDPDDSSDEESDDDLMPGLGYTGGWSAYGSLHPSAPCNFKWRMRPLPQLRRGKR